MSAEQEMSVHTEEHIELICQEVLLQKSISLAKDSDDDHVSETTAFNIAGKSCAEPMDPDEEAQTAPTTHRWYSSDNNERELSISVQNAHVIDHKHSNSENMIPEMAKHASSLPMPLQHETTSNRSSLEIINYRKISLSKALSYNYKIMDMMTDFLFWVRIFVLILSVFLLILAGAYCIGQIIDVKLDIITECDGDKTLEEIWKHSYDAYVDNGGVMNEESQYGWSNESCWTTHKIEVNTNQIWSHNQYKYYWTKKINAQFVLFGLLSVYLICIILYNLITLIIDVIAINKGTLHTKSTIYDEYMASQHGVEDNKNMNIKKNNKTEKNAKLLKCINISKDFYSKYLDEDTTGWIVIKLIGECIEFILQSQALLLYNGYNVFDSNNQNDVYLANKPRFILLFAYIVSFNCFGSGILWLFYASLPGKCHGLLFNRSLFFVDKFSDLLYTLFPFYILIMDDYNENTNDVFVILGQLHIRSIVALLAAFIPLFFLCNKCLLLIISSRRKIFDKAFTNWSSKDVQQNDITKEINWINDNVGKKILISMISFMFIGYSILILTSTPKYIDSSKTYCSSVSENLFLSNETFMGNLSLSESEIQILSDNQELYLWDNCLYKVYPFVHDNKYKCQCRVFVVDWENLETTENERKQHFNLTQDKHFNLTQDIILNGALNHWYMLEKFHSFGVIPASQTFFEFESSMYKSVHMKAFEWKNTFISYIDDGISSWKELEYLAFSDTSIPKTLPSDFGGLQSIQYILFENNAFTDIPSSICNLQNLKVLDVTYEYFIHSLPHCISELDELQAIWIEITQISQIPLSIFNKPNLLELSLFNGYIDYQNLLNYNNISNITNFFQFNNNTRYWLTNNPICDEVASLPPNLQSLVNKTCSHQCKNAWNFGAVYTDYCSPRLLGDGQCTKGCQYANCDWDQGDCVQLCFAEDLANCTYEKLTNNKCDDGCNNEFCSEYNIGSDFAAINYDGYWDEEQQKIIANGPDLYQCPLDGFSFNFSIQACELSESVYLDLNEQSDSYHSCSANNIGNGVCDDSCRTEECLYDRGDCEEGNGCQEGSICGNVYWAWKVLAPPGVYKRNHSWVCSKAWPTAVDVAGNDPGNCTEIVRKEDYNHDGYTNFREFVVLMAHFIDASAPFYKQINCSQCVGMEYYNI